VVWKGWVVVDAVCFAEVGCGDGDVGFGEATEGSDGWEVRSGIASPFSFELVLPMVVYSAPARPEVLRGRIGAEIRGQDAKCDYWKRKGGCGCGTIEISVLLFLSDEWKKDPVLHGSVLEKN
jgi:hypothetical protein